MELIIDGITHSGKYQLVDVNTYLADDCRVDRVWFESCRDDQKIRYYKNNLIVKGDLDLDLISDNSP